MSLCRQEDDFTREKIRWVATLSNGEVILQDDDRPGVEPTKAWIRLAQYIKHNNLRIIKIQIQFCSHIENAVPENAEGYYYIRAADAVAFSGATSTRGYYIIGFLKDNLVYVTKWLIPEIIAVARETRTVQEDDISLIVNPTS